MKPINKLNNKELIELYESKKQQLKYMSYGTKDTWYMEMIKDELNKREGVSNGNN